MEGALNPRHVSHTQAPDKKRTTPPPPPPDQKKQIPTTKNNDPRFEPEHTTAFFAVESSGSLQKQGRLLFFGTLTPRTRPVARTPAPAPNQSKRPRCCCGIVRFIAKTTSFAPLRHPRTPDSTRRPDPRSRSEPEPNDRIFSGIVRFIAKTRSFAPLRHPRTPDSTVSEPEQTTVFLLWNRPAHCDNEVVCSFSAPSHRPI